MQRFRKKPIIIEAMRWDGGNPSDFLIQEVRVTPAGEWGSDKRLVIPTLEGNMICDVGDWIVRGVKGEFYPIKDEIFRETYEPARTGDCELVSN